MTRHNGKPVPSLHVVEATLRIRRKLLRLKHNGYLIRKRKTK